MIVLGLTSFKNSLRKSLNKKPPAKSLQEKVLKVYIRMEKEAKGTKRGRTVFRSGNRNVGDLVLAKGQAVSDAVYDIRKKFVTPYDGPWKVTRVINPSIYEVANEKGKITKFFFNQKAIQHYLPPME